MKPIAILPTLCTLGNAVCGLAAIVCASHLSVAGQLPSEQVAYYVSGWLILGAMVFDMFDGYIARRTKCASQFGAELDSLCDAVSFGVAPAFLLIQMGAGFEGRLARDASMLIAGLYMVCVLLRLARFNVQTTLDAKSHRSFCGLPSPAAAGCLASLMLVRFNFSDPRTVPDAVVNPVIDILAPIVALAVALLMVSRLPYAHLADRFLRRRRNFSRLVQVLLAVFALVLLREWALLLMFWGYAAIGPVQYVLKRSMLISSGEPLPPQAEDSQEASTPVPNR